MKNKNKIISIFLLGVSMTACGIFTAPPPPPPVPALAITYDFVPPETATEKADIAFILLNPSYGKAFEGQNQPMFKNFINYMGTDFEEMLIAKGYSIRGPFDTYDEIVFSDKSETDLMLKPEITFSYEWTTGYLKRKAGYKGTYASSPDSYWIDGTLILGGKVNLVIKESLTQEKLWVKSIALPPKSVYVKTDYHRTNIRSEGIQKAFSDTKYKNAVYLALNDYYKKALQTAWNQLEPQELQALKKQVKTLREKKGY